MGLDVHVMPLWKYFAGDFLSPVEKLFANVQRVGTPKPDARETEARETVENIRFMVREVLRIEPAWTDEGESVFCEQYRYEAFHLLRAYAAEFEAARGAPFVFDASGDPTENPHLKRLTRDVPTAFRHLIKHSDDEGFWLPIPMTHVVLLDPETWFAAGSSHGLLAELDRLAPSLGMTRDWAQLGRGDCAAAKDDPLSELKFGWSVLHAAARLSVEHGLPIVFDG